MADFSALKKKRGTLGAPPQDASTNILAPEVAPVPTGPTLVQLPARTDGRSLRRTGRTVQFATRVTPEFDARFRAVAQQEGISIVELLEKMLDRYSS